jgi:hypothetical protein
MDDETVTKIYNDFATEHGCFLDGILCDPELRYPFLEDMRAELGEVPEAELLQRLIYLRKRGRLARRKPR